MSPKLKNLKTQQLMGRTTVAIALAGTVCFWPPAVSQVPARAATGPSIEVGQVWKFSWEQGEGRLAIHAAYDEKPYGKVITALVYVPSCEFMTLARFSEAAIKASAVGLVRTDIEPERQSQSLRNSIDTLKSEQSKVFTVTVAQFVRETSAGRCR